MGVLGEIEEYREWSLGGVGGNECRGVRELVSRDRKRQEKSSKLELRFSHMHSNPLVLEKFNKSSSPSSHLNYRCEGIPPWSSIHHNKEESSRRDNTTGKKKSCVDLVPESLCWSCVMFVKTEATQRNPSSHRKYVLSSKSTSIQVPSLLPA